MLGTQGLDTNGLSETQVDFDVSESLDAFRRFLLESSNIHGVLRDEHQSQGFMPVHLAWLVFIFGF